MSEPNAPAAKRTAGPVRDIRALGEEARETIGRAREATADLRAARADMLRRSIAVMPAVLQLVEIAAGTLEHAAAAARHLPDEEWAAVMAGSGADDLGDALVAIAGRIITAVYGDVTVPFPMGHEPWRQDEARAAVDSIAARHAELEEPC